MSLKDFSEVFGNKNGNNIAAEEESDAGMWFFFLQHSELKELGSEGMSLAFCLKSLISLRMVLSLTSNYFAIQPSI